MRNVSYLDTAMLLLEMGHGGGGFLFMENRLKKEQQGVIRDSKY